MNRFFSKSSNNFLGWIILIIIILLFIGTIFIGRFFKSEEKMKLSFKNGQTLSFFIAAYNENKEINGSFVLLFQTKTNKCSIINILPKTYIKFGVSHYTLKDALKSNNNYDEILKGISRLIGVDINHYIFLNKESVIRVVDLIEGVEIYTERLKYPKLKVDIPSGMIVLDGDKAVEYLSFILNNEYDSEYDQLKRIQNFMRGFLKLKIDFLEQYNQKIVANYFYKLIDTNISLSEFLIIYDEIKEKFKNGIKNYSENIKTIILYCNKKYLSESVYVYLPKKSGDWIKNEVKDVLLSLEKDLDDRFSGKIIVEILNGTGISGLAARARNYLSSYGFDVLNIGNTENDNYDKTVIIVYDNHYKGKKLADLISCERLVTKNKSEKNKIDVTLILGRDFDGKVVR